ncbi:MAG: NAD(P)/FAD-dependent oxidoreductase [bacterium]
MAQLKLNGVAVVGGGPAGLMAALTAARLGTEVVLIDENLEPGGQLRKQIHKFFGSKAHRAGVRGYRIAQELINDCIAAGVKFLSNSAVFSLNKRTIGLADQHKAVLLKADAVILATGASENAVAFPGCTLPGVMGAGAAQTFANLHRVLPGNRVLMVGGGNVGLIVSYQLLQAGAQVVAVVEALPRISGYQVHAAKIKRAGVPILTGHTVLKACGDGEVQEVTVAAVDDHFMPLPGSERIFDVDTVCLAVGLTPLAELAWQAGCSFSYQPSLGGYVPLHSANMETTMPHVYVAGDIAGVEEASTALEEGMIAGLAAGSSVGLSVPEAEFKAAQLRLQALRCGPFGQMRQQAKNELVKRWTDCHVGG